LGPRASDLASIGIDFGTTNSRMAWYDPRIGGAEIKLQRDAEEGYVHEEVKQVVITCPARFTVLQRQKIEGGGLFSGFRGGGIAGGAGGRGVDLLAGGS
jgi:molecular chaperone DnaK (HSP70)